MRAGQGLRGLLSGRLLQEGSNRLTKGHIESFRPLNLKNVSQTEPSYECPIIMHESL